MTTTALLDIGIPRKNVEGYPDPTCYRALKAIQVPGRFIYGTTNGPSAGWRL